MKKGQFGTKSVKEDNLAPRTIWHRHEKRTIWHRNEKGTIWHRNEKGTIWHQGQFGIAVKNGHFGTIIFWKMHTKILQMCQLNKYICIGYILPTIGGYMTVGGCLCALRALGWETCVSRINIFVLDIFCQHLGDIWQLEGICAPFGRWVGKDVCLMTSWCQIVLFYTVVPNCPPNMDGAKLS